MRGLDFQAEALAPNFPNREPTTGGASPNEPLDPKIERRSR